jgi:linoleate 8R-lipoxygenase/9,12-octadecadienoate 8-hydroperoxide 8R-isomerase
LRKFRDLKSFEDINPGPETQEAMKALYKEPDLVEMYPGFLLEHAKESVFPGSGLCTGFTIISAILSDAVTLGRGDRFYTLVCLR